MNDIDKSGLLLIVFILLTGIIHWSLWAIGGLGLYAYSIWKEK